MKSRWTVLGPGTDANTPVVPCDDEAVDRAEKAIHDWLAQNFASLNLARDLAVIALRAAGETS